MEDLSGDSWERLVSSSGSVSVDKVMMLMMYVNYSIKFIIDFRSAIHIQVRNIHFRLPVRQSGPQRFLRRGNRPAFPTCLWGK